MTCASKHSTGVGLGTFSLLPLIGKVLMVQHCHLMYATGRLESVWIR